MVLEESARCLSVLALLLLSRKRGVMVLLVFVRNLGVLQAPPGMPLPDSGELSESVFLTQLFLFFPAGGGGNSCTKMEVHPFLPSH